MLNGGLNHCRIVAESLGGQRAVDEYTFGSLAVLSDRLERLKGLGKEFANVGFSPEVENLMRRKEAMAVV